MQVNRITNEVWEIPPSEKLGMLVPARIYATPAILQSMDSGVFDQVTNVACLPGIQRYALCMPDGHWGYGFPIGGVAAFDVRHGVISPGGVGYDVNCGMRLIRTDLSLEDVQPRLEQLMTELFRKVPAGVGAGGFVRLNRESLNSVMVKGARWCVEQGYGWHRDLIHIEEGGCIGGADPSKISDRAVSRGINQLGTLGSGNHYLEVQVVSNDRIFDPADGSGLGNYRPRSNRRHGPLRISRIRPSGGERLSESVRKSHAPVRNYGQGPTIGLRAVWIARGAGLFCGHELCGQYGLRQSAGHHPSNSRSLCRGLRTIG